MTDAEHEQLAGLLHSVRGAVALSGYSCPLMDRLYGDWRRVDAGARLCNSSKGERTESLWMNYDPAIHTGSELHLPDEISLKL